MVEKKIPNCYNLLRFASSVCLFETLQVGKMPIYKRMNVESKQGFLLFLCVPSTVSLIKNKYYLARVRIVTASHW